MPSTVAEQLTETLTRLVSERLGADACIACDVSVDLVTPPSPFVFEDLT